MLYDKGKELVLKTLLSHAEVEESGLCVDLGLVVGVGELGLEVEAELDVVFNLVVADLDQQVAALLDGLSRGMKIMKWSEMDERCRENEREGQREGSPASQ